MTTYIQRSTIETFVSFGWLHADDGRRAVFSVRNSNAICGYFD
jgi:hypothetical protein